MQLMLQLFINFETPKMLTLPVPILDGEKVKFLFSHFFVVPQKVL